MTSARVALLACACACVLACGGSPFRGGYAQPEAPLPGSQTLARFLPGHCEDASHAEHAPRFTSVDLVQTQTGRTVLLEHRQGHELLVALNHHDTGADWVFEVLVNATRVRRWDIPRSLRRTGMLEVGRVLTLKAHGEGFEAGLASSHLTCTLVPKGSSVAGEAPALLSIH